jgi:hypothetical protein
MNWLDNKINLVANIDKKIFEIRRLMLQQFVAGSSILMHFNELLEWSMLWKKRRRIMLKAFRL